MKKHNKKKMTYRELLDHIDKRDKQIRQQMEGHRLYAYHELNYLKNWISLTEHMVKWLIDFLFSKRRKKKFDAFIKPLQEERGDKMVAKEQERIRKEEEPILLEHYKNQNKDK